MKTLSIKLILFLLPLQLWAVPNWQRDFEVQLPRENIYQLDGPQWQQTLQQGRKLALLYPVTVSALMVPYQPIKDFFDSKAQDPVRRVLFEMAKVVAPFKSMQEVYDWMGLHAYPAVIQRETPNALPELSPREASLPMGATLIQTKHGEALTFGCAACHASDLFGVKVLGLTNRFPRANVTFKQGQEVFPYINTFIFRDLLQATEGERKIMAQAKRALKFVGTKAPVTLGLDTSLSQVAISLAKRKQDPYATMTELSWRFPRKNKLETMVADSKPAVWWNVKYKNRWLSDGSIVSGNPIHTNFLWNEIGRGTDLKVLERWMQESQAEIEALTAAVFASRPPRYEKFFGVDSIDLARARRGQQHYIQSCQKCHGTYEKGWDQSHAHNLTKTELVQNVQVKYHAQTPIKDVGTDPGRYLGMKEFAADLNRLAISQSIGTVVEPQQGYVPPPLDGIWARWPYFHNNAIPNLCALLTPGPKRPVGYWAGEARDKERDFDQECVGYPIGAKTPEHWKADREYYFDSRKEGLSRFGHDERILIKDGKEIFSASEKMELIEFLKTL
jgi:hypothetical protein